MTKNRNRKIVGGSLCAILLGAVVLILTFQSGLSKRILGSDEAKWPTRRELFGKLREIRKLMLVYGTGNAAAVPHYQKYAEQLWSNRWLTILVKPDTAVTEQELLTYPLAILGTPASNRLIDKMRHQLPLQVRPQGLAISQLFELEDQDVYTLAIFPNPLAPSLPISITTANSDSAILTYLENTTGRSLFESSQFAVYRDGQRVVLGFFDEREGRLWEIDYQNSRNFLVDSNSTVETPHYLFKFHGNGFSKRLPALAEKQEARLSRLLKQLAKGAIDVSRLPKIEYHIYESLEEKGLITRNTDLSHFDERKIQVHAVLNHDLSGTDFCSDSKLVFSKLVGKTDSDVLRDGVGIYFSEDWGKKGYMPWAKLLHDTDNVPTLNEFLDSDIYSKESYLVTRPLAGTFVDFLVQEYGWESFLKLYQVWPERGIPRAALGATLEELGRNWRAFLAKLPSGGVQALSQRPLIKRNDFHKGFCYAHEGYQIYNGYLSRKSFESLKQLRSLGTDWISLSPFGYLRNPNKPDYLRFSFGAGAENDESLLTAASYARQLGMRVMLKPHVLMSGPHWGWPGDVKMESAADWKTFFDRYYKWIRHYALLAEMYDLDILCIGVELMHTTTPEHEQAWREIIAKIRQIYSGPLVYAANWWQEFEQITFWDELDYIGLNCYYPLSRQETVTLKDLKQGVESFLPTIETVARKYDKPVLLTEVGFTSTAKNWLNPHERRRGAPVNLEDQALCYQAIFECFQGKDWLHGFYWWKWPTFLDYGGKHHSGFTPNGKPAEAVVEKWYSREGSMSQ